MSLARPQLIFRFGALVLALLLSGCGEEGDSNNVAGIDITPVDGEVRQQVSDGGISGSGGSGGTTTNNSSSPPADLLAGPPSDGSGTGGAITIAGAALKGPFVVGSTILINKLDDNANSTGSTIVTEVENSIGDFSFTVDEVGVYQIVATGYYFNEVTGYLSSSTLTLKAIHNVLADDDQKAYVNVLTHLINNRVINLMKDGVVIDEAIVQAQIELVQALYEAIPVDNPEDFTSLGLYVDGDSGSEWNGYLLALSIALYEHADQLSVDNGGSTDAELTRYLNVLANDLGDDGLLQTEGVTADLTTALSKINVAEVISNLMTRSQIDFEEPLNVPDLTRFIKACYSETPCVWSSVSALPVPLVLHAMAEYNGKLYAFSGGYVGVGYSQGVVFEYDILADEWQRKTDMPLIYNYPEAHVVADKIYIVDSHGTLTGENQNNILEYDPVQDSWQTKSSIPTYRRNAVSALVGSKVYIFGGKARADDGPNISSAGGDVYFRDYVQIYDPLTDMWSSGTPAEEMFEQASACVVGNDVYILGGIGSEGDASKTNVRVYNVVNDTWRLLEKPIPVAVTFTRCVSVNDSLYLLGTSQPQIYNTATDVWSSMPLPQAVAFGPAVTKVGSKIYVSGGISGVGATGAVDVFDTTGMTE